MPTLPNVDCAGLGAHLDSELIFKFFATFARVEYALKSAGLLTDCAHAEPN